MRLADFKKCHSIMNGNQVELFSLDFSFAGMAKNDLAISKWNMVIAFLCVVAVTNVRGNICHLETSLGIE